MGNLCCSNVSNEERERKASNRRYGRLIDREVYHRMSRLVDSAIINSNLLKMVKDNLKNTDVTECNYNIILKHDYLKNPEYGTILENLKETDMRQIVAKRLLLNLQEITEKNGYNVILSNSRIHSTKVPLLNELNEDYDTKVSTMSCTLSIIADDDGETPDIYTSNRTKSPNRSRSVSDRSGHYKSKASETLYLKILKYDLPHQYDNDIIYQTESKNYFRIKECIICYERQANVLYLGCMHLQLCDSCHSNKKDPNHDSTLAGRRNCPVCNMWTGHKKFDWLILDPLSLERKYPLHP